VIAQETIRHKREGQALSLQEIGDFVAGLVTGEVTESQAAALAMAIFFQGMTAREAADLTNAMAKSGQCLHWDDVPGPVLDKHSTGGVGDNISLILAPAVAACGGYVPMISGRGLGHTGGTLDKLDSIPGYKTTPDLTLFRQVVRQVGCAIIGQTDDLAPADRKLYAIRDVTATVESIPLITASILSKKLAAGLQGLIMDVKTGSGAFMREEAEARLLAHSLAQVASEAGLPTVALITDMNQPLASAVGNALEMRHALQHLTGAKREPRVQDIVVALGAEMLLLGKICASLDAAKSRIENALASGKAAAAFEQMVSALGGPKGLDAVERSLPVAPVIRALPAPRSGFIAAMDAREMGLSLVLLGGARTRPQDAIDHAVGLSDVMPLGTHIKQGEPLLFIHARDEAGAQMVANHLLGCISIAEQAQPEPILIKERLA
jgi:thymidine phosphorylase